MRKHLLTLAAVLVLGACANTPTPVELQPIGFANGAPMKVDAANIQIVEILCSPMRAPNIEHELLQSPAALVKAWVRDRLRAVGPWR